MATQANITLTALAQDDELLPDIPIRNITLNHPNDFVVLGRASIKDPRPIKDAGYVYKKTISRIAAVDNGYMSRNETIASEHATLCLKQNGEVYLEHRAGRFPPTFVNGNQVHRSVLLENNDIINLGPLNEYTSKHKNRTYQPFAFKLNMAFKYTVHTGDEDSSSSEDEELDQAMSTMSAPTPSLPKSSLPSTIRQHEVIDVSSSDDDDSPDNNEDGIWGATPIPQPSQQSQNNKETVIIDLTESEEGPGVYPPWVGSTPTQISYAQYDSSSCDDDETDEEIDKKNTACFYDETNDDDLDDSIFGDDASKAPSEEPIERRPVSGPFSSGFRLDYSPEPELFTSDMDVCLGSDFDSEDSDSEGSDVELFCSDISKQQMPVLGSEFDSEASDVEGDSEELFGSPVPRQQMPVLRSEFDSEDSDVEGDYYDPLPAATPEQQIPAAHPYLSEHLRRFQEEERSRLDNKNMEEERVRFENKAREEERVRLENTERKEERVRLENKEREEEKDRRDDIEARYKRAEEMEGDESLVEEADRWKTGMERERADREKMEMQRQFEEERDALHQLMQKHSQTMHIQAEAMMASQRETSENLALQEDGSQHKMNGQPAGFSYSPVLGASRRQTDSFEMMSEVMGLRQPTPPQQLPAQQPKQTPTYTPDTEILTHPEFDNDMDMNFSPYFGVNCFAYCSVPEKNTTPATFAPRMRSAELPVTSHTTNDYMAARAENRAKIMSATPQPPPPSLLMSSSLFGQALEAGMQLPALPVKNPNAMSSLQSELVTTEHSEKLFDETTGSWLGGRKIRRKVSIQDLLEQEVVARRDEEEEQSGEDTDMEDLEEPVAKESANGGVIRESIVAEGLTDTAAVEAVPLTTSAETAKKQKIEVTKPQEPSIERPFAHYADMANAFAPVSKADELFIAEQANNVTPTPNDQSRAVFGYISQAGSTIRGMEAEIAAAMSPMENKKRKHVVFEEVSTVIPPAKVTISSVLSNGSVDNTVSLTKPSAAKMVFTMSSSASSSPRNGPVKHVHFDHPIAKVLEKRVIATPVGPSRRLKTMKKVAEKAGYAVMGGMVAAVGVFAALVATAPEEF